MSFEWEDLIEVVSHLIDYADDCEVPEAYLRVAIGRSYYAVFCTARERLEARTGAAVSSDSVHTCVRRAFRKSQDPCARRIGAALFELWKHRIDADYALHPRTPIVAARAEMCRARATKAMEELATLDKSLLR